MNTTSRILRNMASNWAGFAINAMVTLVLTPYVLRELGPARYGIWILTSSIIGYYGFLDLGFRAGVTQYLTRYLAAGDYQRASECISSAVAVLATAGLGLFGLSLGAGYLAPHLFDLPAGMEREAFWCIVIVGSSTAIQFALNPYTSVFTATQRFDLANAIGVTTRLLTAAAIAFALKSKLGLVGVSIATCSVSAVDYLIRWQVARRLAPQLQLARRHVSLQRVREVGAFGAWNSLISINAFVYQHVPNLLIGSFMPIAAVGHYALATGLIRQINMVLSPVPQVLYPVAAQLHVCGDRSGLERLYRDGTRLMLLVMTTLVLQAFFWAEDFYHLWIGQRYLAGGSFHSVATVFQILLLSVATSYSATIANNILVGAGYVRTVALALISASVMNLTISVILLPRLGLAGVAIATVSASVIIDLFGMPLLLQRSLGLSPIIFLRDACARPVVVAILQAATLASLRLFERPQQWSTLLLYGALGGVVCVAIVLAVGVTAEERARFVVRPLRRILRGEAPQVEAAAV
jgi:O-antigen/teichoic acid export membrane protein